MSKNISRRSFLKGAAASAVGVAALGLTGLPALAEGESWDAETDVLVVGAGGAGVSAAAEASAAGAKVLVLEKAGIMGGTTNLSGGVMQAAGTKYQKEFTDYQDDTPEKHAALWIKSGEGTVDEELVTDLANGAPGHIDWLADTCGIKWTSIYGHCHIPYVPDELMADRIHVYEGGGAAGSGGIYVRAVWAVAEANGAEMQMNTEVKKLIKDEDGTVIGVVAEQDGKEIRVKANKGVILCTASIDHNLDMAKRLSPQQYFDLTQGSVVMSVGTDTGDGIRMGMEIGADVAGFGGCIDFCGRTGAATDNRTPTFPSFIVNQNGFRFVCEDATYAYHYRAIFQQSVALDGATYMIFGKSSITDSIAVASGYASWDEASANADVEAGALYYGETIEALAEAIGVPAGNLANQLTLWNSMAEEGADTQYGRLTGVEPISGPFYAYKNVAYNLGSLGGLKINVNTEVIDVNGNVIPHLYAAGLNAGGWIGPYYPGSGTAVMGTVHWGRKAGAAAAAN